MITTFIVDDHPSVLHGLKDILNASSDIEVIEEALNGTMLLEKLKIKQPDLILMDLVMEDMNGIEATKAVKELYPAIKILVFTTYLEIEEASKAMELGVEGYIIKDIDNEELIDIIKGVMDGTPYYDERVIEFLMSIAQNTPQKNKDTPLTKREKEVALLIATGKSIKEIAEEFHRSTSTIETHRKHIYSKLGINKVGQLSEYVRTAGWLK
jgi:NarL family two-component system response regulator LiaR